MQRGEGDAGGGAAAVGTARATVDAGRSPGRPGVAVVRVIATSLTAAPRAGETGVRSGAGLALGPALSTALDHLRWLAALLVVLGHARLHTIGSYGDDVVEADAIVVRAFFLVTGLAHEAVVVFFVLSGVLIAGRFVRQPRVAPAALGGYVIDRLTRIWIVALPALVFSMLVAHLGHRLLGDFYSSTPGACAPGLADLGANLLFLHKAFVPVLCSNGPYWSIHNEVWYYLMLPAALLAATAVSAWWRTLGLALSLTAVSVLLWFDPWNRHHTLAYFPIWLAGGLVVAAWRPRLPVGICAAVLVTTLLVVRAAGDWHFLLRDYLLALALIALLLAIRDRGLPGWWSQPGMVDAGRSLAGFSYSLYLTHAPVVFLIRTILETSCAIDLPIRAVGAAALGIMAIEIVAAIAVARWFHLAFERHTGVVRARVRSWLGDPGGRHAGVREGA